MKAREVDIDIEYDTFYFHKFCNILCFILFIQTFHITTDTVVNRFNYVYFCVCAEMKKM